MKTRVCSIAFVLFATIAASTLSSLRLVRAEEPSLETILDMLGVPNRRNEATLETFVPGTYSVKLHAEFASYHMTNNLSSYILQTDEYNLIFSGSEGGFEYVDPPIVKYFSVNSEFGLSFVSPEARYFTQVSKNPDGIKHSMIYRNLDNPDMYLIGFENRLGGGDGDYNDMVIGLELASPQVVNIGGRDWYFRNATNERALIFLDGGQAFPMSLNVLSFDHPDVKTKEKILFINEMVLGGFDCLVNKDTLGYSDTGETCYRMQEIGLRLVTKTSSCLAFLLEALSSQTRSKKSMLQQYSQQR